MHRSAQLALVVNHAGLENLPDAYAVWHSFVPTDAILFELRKRVIVKQFACGDCAHARALPAQSTKLCAPIGCAHGIAVQT